MDLNFTDLDGLQEELMAYGHRQRDPNVVAVAVLCVQILREVRELGKRLDELEASDG